MKKSFFAAALLLSLSLNFTVNAENTSLDDLKEFSLRNVTASDKGKAFDSNHWAYKTLKNITDKYGILVGKPGESFDGMKPLSRNEAAVILVNLMGKVEEQNMKVTAADKARIEILQQELSGEMNRLSGRVAVLENDVADLKGSVSRIEASEKKSWTNAFGEDFMLTGGLQAAYTGAFNSGVDGYSPNFGLPYSEVTITGKAMEHLNYKAQLIPTRNFTDRAGGLLRDVYISTDILPKHNIIIGQVARPVGQEAVLSPMEINFIDYSQTSRKLLSNNTGTGIPYNHDTGIKIDGDWDFINYSAGTFNGTGQNSFDVDKNMTIAGKISVNPFYKNPELGELQIGGSILHGFTSPTALPSGLYENIFGVHASYAYKKLCISGEFLGKDGFTAHGQDARGYFIDTIYTLNDKFQLLARYDRFDPDTAIGNDDSTEYVGGINYMFRDNMMFMVNFVHVNSRFGKNSNRIGFLSQVIF